MKITKSTKNSTKKITILFLFAFFYFIIGIGFDVHAASTEPVFIKVPVVQSFSYKDGSAISNTEKFTYELTPLENANPMPLGTTNGKYEIAIIGNQTVEIGELIYTHAGIYNYQLKLVKSSSSDYKCDVSSYTVVVCVRNEVNGQLGKPDVIIKNNNGQKSKILEYNYVSALAKPGDPSGGTPQTGNRSRMEIWIMLFTSSTMLIILLLAKRRKEPEQEE